MDNRCKNMPTRTPEQFFVKSTKQREQPQQTSRGHSQQSCPFKGLRDLGLSEIWLYTRVLSYAAAQFTAAATSPSSSPGTTGQGSCTPSLELKSDVNQGCARLLQILSDIQDQGSNKGKQGEKTNKKSPKNPQNLSHPCPCDGSFRGLLCSPCCLWWLGPCHQPSITPRAAPCLLP